MITTAERHVLNGDILRTRKGLVVSFCVFLMVQSLFAVMDQHPVEGSLYQHYALHLALEEQYHASVVELDDWKFESVTNNEQYHCENHVHGVKLVSLPLFIPQMVVNQIQQKLSDSTPNLSGAFDSVHYRPPIV